MTTVLSRFLPFLAWAGELRRPNVLRADLIAGITVAMVLIPQSMAYAQLAGLPPYYGLYAAFMPPLIAALFGSSRQLATGPVAVVSLMTAAALEPIATAGSPGYVAYAILLAILVGSFQIVLGLLRLGVLVNFLSHPVVLGFTNAAAIIIATSQLGKIFGVTVEKAEHHYETVWNTLLAAVEGTHMPTLAMALLAFSIMILLRRFRPGLPNVLIAVVVTTVLSWAIGFERSETVPRERIASEAVQRILDDRETLRTEITQLTEQITTTRNRLAELRQQADSDAAELLNTQHELDLLRLKKERRSKSLQADMRELEEVRFSHVTEGDGIRFHLLGQTPAASEPERHDWQVTQIGEEGNITLRAGGAVVGQVPSGLPAPQWPEMEWRVISELIIAAITISLIGFMEAIAIAKGMAARTRQRLDANQELIGQGLGNLVGGVFQSYPTAGSFSRSAVNLDAGAVTGLSSVITTVIVAVVLIWFTPLLYHLPQATLAAVIMMAVIGLVRIQPIRHAWTVSRSDGISAVVTFVLTLAVAPHLDRGILVGVALSLGLYLYSTMKPRLVAVSRHPDGTLRDVEAHGLSTCENISVLRFDGSLYFANTGYFEDKVLEKVASKPELKYVIVDAEGINSIDATGEEALFDLAERLSESGIELLFARTKKQIEDALERTGFIERIGRERFFRRITHALEYVWERLEPGHAEHCPLRAP